MFLVLLWLCHSLLKNFSSFAHFISSGIDCIVLLQLHCVQYWTVHLYYSVALDWITFAKWIIIVSMHACLIHKNKRESVVYFHKYTTHARKKTSRKIHLFSTLNTISHKNARMHAQRTENTFQLAAKWLNWLMWSLIKLANLIYNMHTIDIIRSIVRQQKFCEKFSK